MIPNRFLVKPTHGHWGVRHPGSEKWLGLFLTQAHAVSEARKLAMAERPSEVVIEVDGGTYDVDSKFEAAGSRT